MKLLRKNGPDSLDVALKDDDGLVIKTSNRLLFNRKQYAKIVIKFASCDEFFILCKNCISTRYVGTSQSKPLVEEVAKHLNAKSFSLIGFCI